MRADGAPITWVVGAGGLLGGAVRGALSNEDCWTAETPVRWSTDHALGDLSAALDGFLGQAEGRPWRIAWCAGAGVVGTSEEDLSSEVELIAGFCDRLLAQPAEVSRAGAVFLASSAGGVYAGSPARPPYSESSPACAVAPYGRAKLAAEAQVARLSGSGIPVVIGRIANLYGPGQNLDKAQGLISALCLAHLQGRPLSIYVPMDTLRDYIYADDCARMVVAALDRAVLERPSQPVIKILASGSAHSITALIGAFARITRKRPRVVVGASPLASLQAVDLRLVSEQWPEIDALTTTSLPVGMHRALLGVQREVLAATTG